MVSGGMNTLLEIIRQGGSAAQQPIVFTGTVHSVTPLMVEAAGVILTAADLLVNPRLLPGAIGADETDRLTAGCRVALVTGDLDTFLLLCKVVKP